MIISHFPGGGGDKPFNEIFQYSGNATFIDDGDGNWRVKFLTSGTLTVSKNVFVDIFAVGGGGNGGKGQAGYYTTAGANHASGGGGGGGYTKTERNKKLEQGKSYSVTVGSACGTSSLTDIDGVILCEAAGGKSATGGEYDLAKNGGNGGSGGCPGAVYHNGSYESALPGSDGGDGTDVVVSDVTYGTGGKGQGKTTREFEEETGDLYSGGGGSGGVYHSSSKANVAGAEGGGGAGASKTAAAQDGGENTGGGGGGGVHYNTSYGSSGDTYHTAGGKGGSGIVIIRNFRVATS
jgi:hypothetical protein